MTEIKAGDTVRRHRGQHNLMKVGDVDVVRAVHSSILMDLEKFGMAHDPANFGVAHPSEPKITERDISAFKAGWHAADAEGDEGGRVRRGLESFLAHRAANE